MGEITEDFIERYLEYRFPEENTGELSKEFFESNRGPADLTKLGRLLERIDQRELLRWLKRELERLVDSDSVDGRNNAELLLKHLDQEHSLAGLQFDVYEMGEPEQIVDGSEIEYLQDFEVRFRYNNVEVGSCFLNATGRWESEKWIAWPALLQGLTSLRPVAPWPPTPDIYLIEDPGAPTTSRESRGRDFLLEVERRRAGDLPPTAINSLGPTRPRATGSSPEVGR